MPPGPPRFAPPRVEVQPLPLPHHDGDGGFLLRSPLPLNPHARALGDLLEHWASLTPERAFLTGLTDHTEQAPGAGPRAVTYAEALTTVRSLGAALLALGLGPTRPLLLLSDNDIDHALLQLAAMHVGIPAVPVSPAYSLLSRDLARLRHILAFVRPGAVFAADGAAYARALALAAESDPPPHLLVLVHDRHGAPPGSIPLDTLLATRPDETVDRAFRALSPDTVAKILFTSGSTGMPKGVVNTQRMLCSNQEAIAQLWPFVAERPPVVVDWLPWSHTFGGNHNFNLVLRHGGTLHIDSGRPQPGRIEHTVARLRAVSPTLYFNVPRGYDLLVPFLEEDAALRERFFAELDLLFYAAAALPESLWQRLRRVAERARGRPVPLVSAWGATETAPLVTLVHYGLEHAGNIGLPAPGCELKLAPTGGRLELRVRGPNVTPGYFTGHGPAGPLVERGASFDAEGFYRTGDAGRLADPEDPARGVVFDGRLSENFKLSSGTWVLVGELRVALVGALAPLVQDAVIAGHDRGSLAALLFPAPGCTRAQVASRLADHNRAHPGSSRRIARALLLGEPPSIDAGEITDKGYINQRAVLTRRAAEVERLYAEAPDDEVIALPEGEPNSHGVAPNE